LVGAIVATVLYGHLRSSAARDPHGDGADLQRPCLRRFDSRGDVTVD
jgi:hypothetical protein